MSLTASARSVPGTLRQEVLIDGLHHLVTDEPESVGGGGSAPAPHELFPAALAACVSTTIVMYARTKSWPLDAVDVDVDYDHQSTPTSFTIDIRLAGDLSARPGRTARVGRREVPRAARRRERHRLRRAHRAAGRTRGACGIKGGFDVRTQGIHRRGSTSRSARRSGSTGARHRSTSTSSGAGWTSSSSTGSTTSIRT